MTSKINLGLERISGLLRRLDSPHKRYDVIHVAGTNGKGSVSAMIANTLTRAGVKTGLYTSPHLKYRWDTIQINNKAISYADYSRVDASIKAETKCLKDEMRAEGKSDSDVSTFEQMTATALQTFREQEVEVAVVEVGLGGAHDATNVVQPIVSVITSIGLDHTAFLGTSIQGIARAKGGIIKPGTPVVVSSDQEYGQVYGVLGQVQREVNPNSKIIWTPPNSTLDFRISNKNTARTVLEHLREQAAAGKRSTRYGLSSEVIEEGLSTTKWSGRCSFEDLSALGGSINTLIDGAHNDQSIEALDNVLAESRNKPRTFIVALTEGKMLNCLHRLLRPGDQLFTVEFEDVDGMEWIRPVDSHELYSALVKSSKFDLPGQAYGKDVAGAIKDSNTTPTNERDVVICGSLYLVGQVYRMLDSAKHETAAFPDNDSGSLGVYEPAVVESKVQQYWSSLPPTNPATGQHKSGIVKFLLPPPNVTGSLHIGHALTVAIQDTYCRYFHAIGHQVQWVPGVDHAGIATQSVVAKTLAKLGVQAHDLSREEFVSRIWDWRHQYGNIITQQIRRLGTSLDWSSEYFTMDQPRAAAVNEAFRKLWDAGLITRENRMVNWSVPLQSVISDIEVDTQVIETPTMLDGAEFGKMWRIRFELSEPTSEYQFIEVDTTRPETIFADRAVAVNPRDERYAAIVGQNLKHPLLANVMLRVVADYQVTSEFGTGCVKLTPAHDRNDHEISQRHSNIPCISVFGRDGKMLDFPGYEELAGQDRLLARAKVVAMLEQKGALSTSRPHKTTLHLCSRSGAVIEPLLIPQWYIKMQGLADQVQQQNNIKMSTKTAKEWNKWLSNVQDWCVSRQLVWGHRVPLWRITEANNGAEQWVYGVSEDEARKNANGREVVQDEDVLDTWFSSGLLPLSAFGWPSTTFENQFIESGPDILFFWLARMAMLCTFLTGTPPFKEIILHPLIRDSQGRKMSKSLGNVIDPLSLIEGQSLQQLHANIERGNINASELQNAVKEITQLYPQGMPAYGADALRFALIQSTIQTEALKFDIRSVTAARYLCNKLWNAVNFYAYNMNKHNLSNTDLPKSSEAHYSLVDHWILHQQENTIKDYHTGFMERDLAASSEALRTFFLDQFCDIYLEFVKIDIRQAGNDRAVIAQKLSLVREILVDSLHRFSPFMPHVTEYLWHTLGNKCSLHEEIFRVSSTRSFTLVENRVMTRMKTLLTILQTLRTLPAQQIDTVEIAITKDNESLDDITTHLPHFQAMASVPTLSLNTNSSTLQNVLPITSNLSISYNTLVAVDTQIPSSADRRNLAKLEKLRVLVATDDYSARVPEAIKHKHRAEILILETRLERFL